MIDLRSDTVTKPTPAMLAAMTAAEVGDEQFREDPTVNELQRRVAELVGQQAALFLPTATMANEIALRVQTRPGQVLLAEERTHVLIYEAGGPAVHSGLIMHGVPAVAGRLTPERIRAEEELGPGGVVVLENTHRSSGGRVWPPDLYRAAVAAARERGAAVHLDGARLLNASVAAGIAPAEWGRLADSVTVCFSKGLGCPLGAAIAGSAELIERAWEAKFLFGGAMRQAGVVAAAALYALDNNVERLAEDHARARRLAEGLAEAAVAVDTDAVETNFVALVPAGEAAEALARAQEEGVLLGELRPGVLRAVTHLGVDDDAVERAIELLPRALGA